MSPFSPPPSRAGGFPRRAVALGLFSLLAARTAGAQQVFTLTPVAGTPAGRKLVRLQATLPAQTDHVVEDSANLVQWNRVSTVLRPAAGALDWSLTQAGILGNEPIHVSGTSNWWTRRFYRVGTIPSADAAPAAVPGMSPTGRLTQPAANGPYFLTTPADWTIKMDRTTMTVTGPNGHHYELWGQNGHENLRGKHIKDMFGTRRTLLLPGGTMITVVLSTTAGTYPAGTIERISIYDGNESHRLNMQTNLVEMSAALTRAGEAAEPDGETGRLWDTGDGLFFENIYEQTNPSDGQPQPQTTIEMGRTFISNPNRVNDHYDDPRLGHT